MADKRSDPFLTALYYTERAEAKVDDETPPDVLVGLAQTHALLAVFTQLRDLRGDVAGVEQALKDRDGFGPADHLRYVSEWLEKIADRLR